MPNTAYLDFYYEKKKTLSYIVDNPIKITALDDNFVLKIKLSQAYRVYYFNYSYDNGMTWYGIRLNDETVSEYSFDSLDRGETLLLSGNNLTLQYMYFTSNTGKKFNVSGNIMNLLDPVEIDHSIIPYDYCFKGLFKNSNVVDASNLKLPATTLKVECYKEMFYGCQYLKSAPALPATTLPANCYESMFYGCTSLNIVQQLPATSLANNCYTSMFRGCTSLNTAPALPATTLTNNCYKEMFYGCTALTVAPVLSTTILAPNCYESMFYGCTSLNTAPALPATTLATSCYLNMFQGCTSLQTAPDLPAQTLVYQCYSGMFRNCTNLNYIKILATQRANSDTFVWVQNVAPTGTFVKDANGLFDIDSIHGVPIGWTVYDIGDLIVTYYTVTLNIDPEGCGIVYGDGIYERNDIATIIASPSAGYIFDGFYENNTLVYPYTPYQFPVQRNRDITAKFIVDPTVYYTIVLDQDPYIEATLTGAGTYAENTSVTITASPSDEYNFVGWKKRGTSNYQSYDRIATFTITSDLDLIAEYEEIPPTLYYTLTLYTTPEGAGVVAGGGTYEEGTRVTVTATPISGYRFSYWQYNGIEFSTNSTVSFDLNQDIELIAMFEIDDVDYDHEYLTIESLEDANTITLYRSAYQGSVAPTIEYKINGGRWNSIHFYSGDNTIAIIGAYDKIYFRRAIYSRDDPNRMNFISIRGNKQHNAYGNIMSLLTSHIDTVNSTDTYFAGLNLTTLSGDEGFDNLFNGDEYLVNANNIKLPATTLTNSCYAYMFQTCTRLITAPSLPATTMQNSCYSGMFYSCSSLTTAPALPATTLAANCYSGMFFMCFALMSAPELPATTLANNCYGSMFYDCYSLTVAPELPATTLLPNCYEQMFDMCSSLHSIKCLATDISATDCIKNWVRDVAEIGTFIKAGTMEEWDDATSENDYAGIPENWNIEDYSIIH